MSEHKNWCALYLSDPAAGKSCDCGVAKDDEPSVMGAGHLPVPMPTKADAEKAWRELYVARMVERGIDRKDAQACCDAGDVDLSEDPADAADDELQYWSADE